MKPSALIKDDDAVSPVIGVILMVAITVILAAVIASFVLGLGDTQGDVQPNSSFSYDYEPGSPGDLTITLTDGDTLNEDEVIFRGSQFAAAGSNLASAASVSGGEWDVGESITINAQTDYELSIVWEEIDGDNAATLSTSEGPDA